MIWSPSLRPYASETAYAYGPYVLTSRQYHVARSVGPGTFATTSSEGTATIDSPSRSPMMAYSAPSGAV